MRVGAVRAAADLRVDGRCCLAHGLADRFADRRARPCAVRGGSISGGTVSATRPCDWRSRTRYRHVVWIWMENRSYSSVLGSAGDAPNLERYARKCGLATNYQAITHPSLPNYLATVGGATFGITTDCGPDDCPVSRSSIFQQVTRHGMRWSGYAEAMSTNCDHASYGRYAARHNPATYFTKIAKACRHRDVPMGGAHGPFADALRGDSLAAFTTVVPNLCHDGHDCSTATADTWLGKWLDRITASNAYAAGHTVVFVTWDEGVGADNQVATVVIGPTVPKGTRVSRALDHYSLLRTTEQLLGLPYLRAAATAKNMRRPFHL